MQFVEDRLGHGVQVGSRVVIASLNYKRASLRTGTVKAIEDGAVVVTTDRTEYAAQAGTSRKSIRNGKCKEVIVIG